MNAEVKITSIEYLMNINSVLVSRIRTNDPDPRKRLHYVSAARFRNEGRVIKDAFVRSILYKDIGVDTDGVSTNIPADCPCCGEILKERRVRDIVVKIYCDNQECTGYIANVFRRLLHCLGIKAPRAEVIHDKLVKGLGYKYLSAFFCTIDRSAVKEFFLENFEDGEKIRTELKAKLYEGFEFRTMLMTAGLSYNKATDIAGMFRSSKDYIKFMNFIMNSRDPRNLLKHISVLKHFNSDVELSRKHLAVLSDALRWTKKNNFYGGDK